MRNGVCKMNINLKKHLDLLGLKVEDKVNGIVGIVTCVGFDLYGCVQAIVNPGKGKDGKLEESVWLDVSRLKILCETPVIPVPDYDYGPVAEGKKGPAEKPRFYKP